MGEKHIEGVVFINDNKVLTDGSRAVTLQSSEWSGNQQTIHIPEVTSSSLVFVSPEGDPKAYAEAGIYCSEQGSGYLTFTCEKTPSTDINVNVILMG